MKYVLLLIGILTSTSCAAPHPGEAWREDDSGLKRMSTAEVKACKAINGTVTQGYSAETCVYPTEDAGKICADSKECVAGCIAPRGAVQGAEVQGTCRAVNGAGGCINWVYGGVATGEVCAD